MQIHKSLKGLEVKQLPVNRFKEKHQRKFVFFPSLEPDLQISLHLLILLASFNHSHFSYILYLTSVFPILLLVFHNPIIHFFLHHLQCLHHFFFPFISLLFLYLFITPFYFLHSPFSQKFSNGCLVQSFLLVEELSN